MTNRFVTTIAMTLLSLIILEGFLHFSAIGPLFNSFVTNEAIYHDMLRAPLSVKEKDNRFIKHNIYLLENLSNKKDITAGFIGTSRTKALQPSRFGVLNAFNSGSNSYNEITYGLILEAEVLRHYLPNLKKIYVESSLLLRRPAPPRYVVEKEHLIYLPLLKNLFEYRKSFPQFESFKSFVAGGDINDFKLLIFSESKRFTLVNLFGIEKESNVLELAKSKTFDNLNTLGEYKSKFSFKNDSPKPAINSANEKVSRIKDVLEFQPFDYLFEMLAVWSKANGIEVVFYQPPVRSDMQSFQFKYGLGYHNESLKKLAVNQSVKVINMNFRNNGFSDDWEIFSDEDHLTTCKGNATLFAAISSGESEINSEGEFYVEVSQQDIEHDILRSTALYCR